MEASKSNVDQMPFEVGRVVPIVRIFDEDRAREFYLGYLGCRVDWEHRFDGEGPLYMQVSRGALVLHLSEHHGDGSRDTPSTSPRAAFESCTPSSRGRTTPSSTRASPRVRVTARAAHASLSWTRSANALRIDERVGSRVA